MGSLGAAMDAARLDLPDARNRDGVLLGLLRTRLGRLVVLGSRGERFADAVARRHSAIAFSRGDGETKFAQGVDHPACNTHFLAFIDRYVPGAIRGVDLGPYLLERSCARPVHSGNPDGVHR